MPLTHRRRRGVLALSVFPALLLGLAACSGSDDDGGDTDADGPTQQDAHLTFEALEDLVAKEVPADASCAAHRWTDVNPTLAPIFGEATVSHELGCWADEQDVSASVPAEVLYAEFADEATATSFVEANFAFSYDIVQDGATVALVSIVSLPDLATDIAGLCDCDVQEGKTP
ncbi:MAG TPA: hypothetical protein VM575_17475 [Nocardioides sp.]|nr:hypothetical protein [Nocardioides sp.]